MKVAHIVRRFTFDEWGGTENVVWHSVLHQRRLGVDAEIFTTSALSTSGTEVRDGVTIRRFPYWYPYVPMPQTTKTALDKKGGNPFSPALFKALSDKSFDVFHIHAGGRLAVQAMKLAKKLGIPSLISLHGGHLDVPKEEVEHMMAPLKGKFNYGGIWDRLLGLRTDAVAGVDAVICIGRQEESLLRQRYPEKRILFFPNGIDSHDFREHPAVSPRCEWGIPKDRKLIVCISRIDYQKNQMLLLELLERKQDTHLLCIGPITSEWYRDALLQRVHEHHLEDRFTLIPGLSPEDPRLVQILHEADVFVLPSVHEPFGIVVLEAWAAGLPVIASNAGGLDSLIADGETGLKFPSEDGEALVKAWERLDASPDLRQALVAKAAEAVKQYEWPSLMKRLISIYQELIDLKHQ